MLTLMPDLRRSAVLCGGAFVLFVLVAVAGNAMPEAVRSGPAMRFGLRVVFFGLVGVFACSAVPFMVDAVFDAQPGLRGRQGSARTGIVWAIWALMGAGLLLAVPAALLFRSVR